MTSTTTRLGLVADLGGTHARLALADNGQLLTETVRVLKCADYASFSEALQSFLDEVAGFAAKDDPVAQACLAVASPIADGPIAFTNNHWSFDPPLLASEMRWQQLEVINDFNAMALGCAALDAVQRVQVFGGQEKAGAPKLVIGPGTGLGTSALVWGPGGWIALQCQGGHVDLPVVSDLDVQIHSLLRKAHGRISAERVISGFGLVNLYRAHASLAGAEPRWTEAAQITAAAVEGSDPVCVSTLDHFCELLGRVAGNAALTTGSLGGVYLCGGILPRIEEFLRSSSFHAAMLDKGRMRSFLLDVPVYLVKEPLTGLIGAARALAPPA